jgi:ketosteroid isomerase-like protein
MSEANVEVVRRCTEAIMRGDRDAILAELHPEIEIDDQDIIDADDYRGPGSLFRWLARWGESWESWRVEGLELVPASDDRVVSLFRMFVTGKGSGIEVSRRDATVNTVRDGKVAKIGYYNDQDQALEAAGLSARAAER